MCFLIPVTCSVEWLQNYLIRFGRHRSMSLGKHPLMVRPSIIDPSPPFFGLRSLDVSAASPVSFALRLLWWILPAEVCGSCLIEQHVKHASSLSMVLWLDFSRTFPRLSNLTITPPPKSHGHYILMFALVYPSHVTWILNLASI